MPVFPVNRQPPTITMNVSAYIHIPFCIRKCLYCDFASYPGKEHFFQPYVEAVRAEIRRAAELFPDARIPTIYFGGGTPNLLAPEQLESILDEVKRCFRVAEDAEITTEANPGVAGCQLPVASKPPRPSGPVPLRKGDSPENREGHSTIRNLCEVGFNRLSLGVQSFHDNELRALGRVHTAEEAIRSFRDARESEFENISIDLMYGIPEQTLESWRETWDGALDLGPEHISLYSLTVEEGTPFWDMCQAGNLQLPGNDIEADMYEEAIRVLTGAGFVHYEISNFARPGFECRHNITYWRNEPYFGFGSGAASYLCDVRAMNMRSVEEYIRRIESGQSPVESEEQLAQRESMGETMFLGLRMLRGVDVNAFIRRYGISPDEAFPAEIANLMERGLIEKADNCIRLTHIGLLLANDVFAEFVG